MSDLKNKKQILLTGIRASGDIHLGNYLGAIRPAIARQNDFESYFFVADLHGLTTTPPAEELKKNVQSITAAWLAAGLDTKKTILWRQSDVPEVLELCHILTCLTTMGLLERAHSYKDALAKSKTVKAGLFLYPVLMAADILLYESDLVPVGKDQAQHLEMTRDMATFFNETYKPFFKLPKALILDDVATVPGTDGRKMSKSYGNGIDLFAEENVLKKQIMGIKTDSKGLADSKVADEVVIYQLFKLIASESEAAEMKRKLEAGNYGYGDAKKELLNKILDSYGAMRKDFTRLISNPGDLEAELRRGGEKARQKASKIIKQVKEIVGLAS
ncbi:MAG: Tryptophan--tRNA ligase [Bacteriovoracaceae bacterium]|nr:Tryptophan--tRNA ligase [Bacteriovoracaceae bacterium]